MNRRQKIIVSITGIFVVLLALVGLTYGYFLTRIQGNTNDKSISVTTANLALVYGDGSPSLLTSDTAITPNSETPIGTKTFTVTNNGDATVENYAVYLEEFKVVYANNYSDKNVTQVKGESTYFESPYDFRIEMTCKAYYTDGNGTDGPKDCSGVTNGELPITKNEVTGNDILTNGYIVINSIDEGVTHEYTMQLYYDETGENQSADMNKTLEAKIQIYNQPDVIAIAGEVTGASEGDFLQINSTPRTSQIVYGNYKIGAIEPGTHTLTVRSKDGTILGSRTIIINKGTEVGVVDGTEATTITMDDYSEEATVNVTNITTNLGVSSEKTIIQYSTPSLLEKLMSDTRVAKNDSTPDFSEPGTTIEGYYGDGEPGMYSAEDDYGTSWYFRGKSSVNYVYFANLYWRIVRINGDGSIRLILDGTLDKVKHLHQYVYKNANLRALDSDGLINFNDFCYDNAYIGYMHGANSDNYDLTHKNTNDSFIKEYLDTFYQEYISDYERLLADSMFCGDKTFYEGDGIGSNTTEYSATERLFSGSSPTLECAKNASNTYSRYTSKIDTSTETVKDISVNNDLNYPIGLLSADELVMAGAAAGLTNPTNTSFYLYDAYMDGNLNDYWWTMTPEHYYDDVGAAMFAASADGLSAGNVCGDFYGIRPVINLRSDILWNGGNGTKTEPYSVWLPYWIS